jgi:hypothetical protein
MYPPENLLSDDMTKFNYLGCLTDTKELFIEINFDKAVQISAIGFKSANNYEHLDPKYIEILTWDSEDKVMSSDFFLHSDKNSSPKLVKKIPLNFDRRL